jgi:hypothetical protein
MTQRTFNTRREKLAELSLALMAGGTAIDQTWAIVSAELHTKEENANENVTNQSQA